jgi:chemotaxis protein CheD
MNILETDLPVIHLKTGQIYIGDKPALIVTVLGSCVSVTMFNNRLRMAAMCHGSLPKCDKYQYVSTDNYTDSFKYVDFSINYMVDKLSNYGIKPGEIEVKLFGGADMFSFGYVTGDKLSVGKQNVQVALNTIEEKKLTLLISDTGGTRGRKIFFYTHTGEVLLKHIKKGGD